jgi:hypothetical protein
VLTFAALNRIDLDSRALLFMIAVSAAAWLIAALPSVLFSGRISMLDALRIDSRTSTGSRLSAIARRTLTATEVALATLLLIGAVLGGATYQRLLAVDKGFDSTNLAALRVRVPQAAYSTSYAQQFLADDLVSRAGAHPGVVSAAAVEQMLPRFAGSSTSRVFTETGDLGVAQRYSYTAGPGFFETIGLPLLDGRAPAPGEPVEHLVVSERFAQRFWPGERAVGKRFGTSDQDPNRYLVIGVVPSVTHERNPDGSGAEAFETYPPRRFTVDDPGTARTTGYSYVTIVARLEVPERAADLAGIVTSLDPRLLPRISMDDDDYAALFEDRQASAAILNGFGLFSFAVAMAGVYGVMSFLVATRRREIGIRVALGADAARIRRQVLGASLRMTLVGVCVGLGLAAGVSRWVESYLFGVTATEFSVYGLVAIGVLATTMLATWQPASAAARVDPSVTLKA